MTQNPYVIVAGPDARHARARAAAADVARDIEDEDHGGRGWSCRDPEGHFRNVGSYDPSAA
ncbi:hypothetical protein SAMN06265365_11876 [Tistlia consotensis]|uniref:Uncharacterized protein n=1 Tax=Tistlia consotensis USBA 355 TaxID=560819 RepID=A0A1Y6CG77_9PROT|nr:hypothetical protein [Tistlia consotensis]SMF53952.1 hypothetical protein SAMN05428998_11977 [Tistlia consotensis USBA 355]SNR86276.1 hypothetical protein SAMN06265365_11876 [Tistlia consotensis]